jgi:hypothetical protein
MLLARAGCFTVLLRTVPLQLSTRDAEARMRCAIYACQLASIRAVQAVALKFVQGVWRLFLWKVGVT